MKDRTRRARQRAIVALALLGVLVFAGHAAPAAAGPLGSPQQVSFTDPLEDVNFDSENSAIAYGGGRSLVVWEADVGQEGTTRGRRDTVIMGRFVNGSGGPISSPMQISDDEPGAREQNPDVAYDSSADRFLVVWDSNLLPEETKGRGDSDRVIRGARVSRSGDVTRPSTLLTPEDDRFSDPAVSFGSATGEFLVAYADTGGNVLIRKVAADTLEPGPEQNITEGQGFLQFACVRLAIEEDACGPQVDAAFDAAAGRWLVVFQSILSNDPTRGAPASDKSFEIYGRSFDADLDGSPVERVSHGDPEDESESVAPAVAADETGGGFMVAYEHRSLLLIDVPDNNVRGTVGIPTAEIFARRVNGDGTVGGDAQPVSEPTEFTTPPEDKIDLLENLHFGQRPDIWHDPNADQFLVTWAQLTGVPGIIEQRGFFLPDFLAEYEIFGKRISSGGGSLESEQRISNHRPDDDETGEFDGDLPAVTYDRTVCDYVVSWTGEELGEEFDRGLFDEKREVWDRPYDAPSCPQPEPPSAAAGQVAASRVCTSRRNFPIRLVKRRSRDYEFALVKVNGQPVNVTYGDRVRSQVNLVGLPVGRYSVDIEARLKNGRTLKGVRRYFTCNRKLPPSNGLDRPEAL